MTEAVPSTDARPARDTLLAEAIRHNANHMALFDPEERLVAWSLVYERFHQEVFDALRAEGRLHEARFPEFVRRSLARQYPPERLEKEVETRVEHHRRADGRPRDRFIPGMGWYQISKVRTPSGGVITTGVDIGALKAKEAEIESARALSEAANAAKSAFLANMSHEFRTPLNGVLGIAALLEETPLDARQGEYVRLIRSSADTLLALINQLLDIAAIEAGRLSLKAEPFEPGAALSDVAAMVRAASSDRTRPLDYALEIAGAGRVLGDETRFRQILWNLIGNAGKFARSRVETRLSVERLGAFARLRLTVDDDGPGVPEAARATIFERFEQGASGPGARPRGTGLGLAICRSLLDEMGGDVVCEAAPIGGARFRVEVAMKAEPPLDDAAERR